MGFRRAFPGQIRAPRRAVAVVDDDWLQRIQGAIFADRLDSQANLDAWEAPDSPVGHITLDTVIKPAGSTASAKFSILSADSTNSGQLSIPLTAFGEGATRWISYRVYFQADDAFAPRPTNGGTPAGTKLSILSRDGNGPSPTGSNQENELVIDLMTGGSVATGELNGYWQIGGGAYGLVELGFSSQLNGSDFRGQPGVDNGSPLTGTNPDTGSAWSLSEQERASYGNTYGARSSPGVANFKPGLGDPFQGSFRPYPGEWLTITFRIIVGDWDVSNSRWTLWAAREGQPYRLLWDKQNIELGTDADYNGFNPMVYATDGKAGGRRVSSRTGELASCFAINNVGPDHTTGSGTLSYNATTGRFTWQASGDSAGTARGHSSANGILRLNLISSTTATNYINGLVTPANLPSSGTTNETVTIATDRPDTQRNYADFIFSASAINAPGGYAPKYSDLALASAAMSSGDWAPFTMGGLNAALFDTTGGGGIMNIAGYASRMRWDPLHRKLQFAGVTHTGGGTPVANAGAFITWDDATNQWSRSTYAWASENPGHAYHHLAIDPSGNLYYRSYNSTTIRRLAYGDGADVADWETGHVTNIGGGYGGQISGGLEWYPELNGGAGGLVFLDYLGFNWTSADLQTWSTQSGDSQSGDHDNNIVYAGGFIYGGGGVGTGTGGDPLAFFRMGPTGTITTMDDLPFAANHSLGGIDGGEGFLIADADGVGVLLFETEGTDLRRFDGSSWSDIGSHQMTDWPMVCCAVPEYRVVVCIYDILGTPTAKIFKR